MSSYPSRFEGAGSLFANSPLHRVFGSYSSDRLENDGDSATGPADRTQDDAGLSESPWNCQSPMSRHGAPRRSGSPLPPIRRIRSRSFNDALGPDHPAASPLVLVPPLRPIAERQRHQQLGRLRNDPSKGNDEKHVEWNARPQHHQRLLLQPRHSHPPSYSSIQSYDTYHSQNRHHESPIGRPENAAESRTADRPADTRLGTHQTELPISESAVVPTTDRPTTDAAPPNDPQNPVWISTLYGLINATIVLPVLMSFGSIIYRDDAFQPYMPVLIKLTVVSGIVHQICFSTLSSLPFAVGQVQDAGLIFLSAMAKNIVVYCRSNGYDDETLLATTTVGLGCATAVLGLGLIVVGRLRLAGYVQMLPTCVIGGYLAFIGWFCGISGVALMAGVSSLTPIIFYQNLQFVLPGILGGLLIYSSVRRFKHVAVLPTSIIILLLVFYGVLRLSRTSVADATAEGWIRKSEPAPVWYHTWDYLKLDKVVWSALPQLVSTEIAMIFVVALSSSLDVAAIELEMHQPLNYNRELTMVGVSNVLSGLTGGYTGSYIFSQSIFNLRSGVRSRLAGYVLAGCQILIVVLPFPILDYVPNFFYGSLLSMICIDLIWEWLVEIRIRVTPAEYVICLATFICIHLTNVEYGILVGVLVYVACWQIGIDVGELKTATLDDEDARNSDTTDETHLSHSEV